MASKKISIERNLAILYGMVLACFVTFLCIWVARGSSQDQAECIEIGPCHQLDTEPIANQLKLWKLSSTDHKTLVHVKGYFQFYYNNRETNLNSKRYLPLDLRSIRWSEHKSNKTSRLADKARPAESFDKNLVTKRTLIMDTSCSSIELEFTNSPDETKWKFQHGKALIDLHGMGALYHICTLDQFSEFERYTHYRCPKSSSHNCRPQSSVDSSAFQVQLHLDEFEFEISGKPDQLRDGQFSKPGHECNKSGNESDLNP